LSSVESQDGFRIARKPPSVALATLQSIADTKHLFKPIGEGAVPDYWQDESPEGSPKWQTAIQPTPNNRSSKFDWSAKVAEVPKDTTAMIRYRHRVLDPDAPKPTSAKDFRYITDFTAYNQKTFRTPNGRADMIESDGAHWVGDLAAEWNVSTSKGTQALELLLVEGGVEFLCQIDLSTGQATAKAIFEGNPISVFESPNGLVDKLEAKTPIRSGSSHRIRYANIDDALRLWVDGKSIAWGRQGGYSILAAVPNYRHLPRYTPTNPLDSAPLGIGIRGGSGTIQRAQVFRDIFYTASTSGGSLSSRFDEAINVRNTKDPYRQAQGESRENYSTDGLVFKLGADDFFPMGDNTQASSDARMWNKRDQPGQPMPGQPGRLMIGRAVMVFWPHYWYYGKIPFIPNFQRIGLIR